MYTTQHTQGMLSRGAFGSYNFSLFTSAWNNTLIIIIIIKYDHKHHSTDVSSSFKDYSCIKVTGLSGIQNFSFENKSTLFLFILCKCAELTYNKQTWSSVCVHKD